MVDRGHFSRTFLFSRTAGILRASSGGNWHFRCMFGSRTDSSYPRDFSGQEYLAITVPCFAGCRDIALVWKERLVRTTSRVVVQGVAAPVVQDDLSSKNGPYAITSAPTPLMNLGGRLPRDLRASRTPVTISHAIWSSGGGGEVRHSLRSNSPAIPC